ncbi:MAG: GTP diphosphokinase [Candidatus Competibacteraceae bacterium]|nr:GTP diphosphokinase [Candidatus Competibacteraceae bacterium]
MVSVAKTPPANTDFEQWLSTLSSSWSDEQRERIKQAHHATLVAHPDNVIGLTAADLLADLRLDHEAIIAALLHQAVSSKALPQDLVRQRFGAGVAVLVEGIERLDTIGVLHQRGLHNPTQLEGLRKMLLAMAQDVRVVLIKLALQLCRMRSIKQLAEPEQQRLAHETMDIFAPLANRLGIGQFKWEMEDLALRTIDPISYKAIAKALDERRRDREHYINSVLEQLRQTLDRAGIEADLTGRVKHIYSIWRKMQRKQLPFEQIFDVRAVRILVHTVAECYSALGVVHTLWKNIPQEFDDYIANPKGNGYQSLHTAVIGPQGKTLEVQIRTYEMHQSCELGVAAHWRYKEDSKTRDLAFERQIAWLRNLLEYKDAADSDELLDQFKAEVFQDRVYVLTPKGDILDLAQGATPLDFAYTIHTEIGHRCRGAKINGRIVPLNYELQNGDQVEIMTSREGAPSPNWLRPHLGYLRTSRARAKVRQWFRLQDREKTMQAGRQALEQEFQRLALKLKQVDLDKLAARFNFCRPDELFIAIGNDELTTTAVASALQEQILPGGRPGGLGIVRKDKAFVPVARKSQSNDKDTGIRIRGVGNLLTTIAGCCKPVPPEPIIGFITHGRGVTIHRQDCPNLLNLETFHQERFIDVDWGLEDALYPVDVQIDAYDRSGLLRDITWVLANEKVNVIALNTQSDLEKSTARLRLSVEVGDIAQLSRLLDKLSQLRNVIAVQRYTQ